MKKLPMKLLIILVCLVGLTGCDPTAYYHYANQERVAGIVAVELIYYDNSDVYKINTFFSTRQVERFDFDKMTVLETLGEGQMADFLQDLAKVEIWTRWIHADSPFGISLRIIYANGDFEVVSVDLNEDLPFFARYNRRGRLRDYIGMFHYEEDFANIINKHFETQIVLPN